MRQEVDIPWDLSVLDSVDIISGWERVAREVQKVRLRLLRATRALEEAGIAHAVVGGHAVAE